MAGAEQNRQRRRARHTERQATDPEYRRKKSEQTIRWRAANPEKVRAQGRRRYASDPEKFIAKKKAWRAANPARVREINRKSRLKLSYGITPATLKSLLVSTSDN